MNLTGDKATSETRMHPLFASQVCGVPVAVAIQSVNQMTCARSDGWGFAATDRRSDEQVQVGDRRLHQYMHAIGTSQPGICHLVKVSWRVDDES